MCDDTNVARQSRIGYSLTDDRRPTTDDRRPTTDD
jgi:hypothetical protein